MRPKPPWWKHRPVRAFSQATQSEVRYAIKCGLGHKMPVLPSWISIATYLATAPYKQGRRLIRVWGCFGAEGGERDNRDQQSFPWGNR